MGDPRKGMDGEMSPRTHWWVTLDSQVGKSQTDHRAKEVTTGQLVRSGTTLQASGGWE